MPKHTACFLISSIFQLICINKNFWYANYNIRSTFGCVKTQSQDDENSDFVLCSWDIPDECCIVYISATCNSNETSFFDIPNIKCFLWELINTTDQMMQLFDWTYVS